MSETLEHALALLAKPSVTPDDAGCQQYMAEFLEPLGFKIETMQFGDVTNLWARRGTTEPVFCFAGHTDVVPTGAESEWQSDPFTPTIEGDTLTGRGAADMKGSLAAMLTATKEFIDNHTEHKGSIAYLITSDEEGPAVDGTVKVMQTLDARSEKIDYCLIGEPSSSNEIGDVVKNGRRGSLGGNLTIKGVQGHVAYPQEADNPIHHSSKVLKTLLDAKWDNGNEFFPPTSFQITNINSGTGATNVIPGDLHLVFNFRYSSEVTDTDLKQKVEAMLDTLEIDYELKWTLFGLPFITGAGALVNATSAAIKNVTKKDTELSTAGGTSDGRFIAPYGVEVLELGPVNETIHKINENTSVSGLDTLAQIYQEVLKQLLTD